MTFIQHMFPVVSHWLEENSSGNAGTLPKVLNLLSGESFQILLSGPDTADKTSLAFQATVSAAASGIRVNHICTHPFTRLPASVHGMATPEVDVMKDVDFLYFENCHDLLSWCAQIHTKKKLPGLIVIEDILTYASQISEDNIEHSLARLCSTICDAASWIRANSDIKRCDVLMTAPTRILPMESILSSCHFQVAKYQGPSKEDSCSRLSYSSDRASINIAFCHKKSNLMMSNLTCQIRAKDMENSVEEQSLSDVRGMES